jgi:hypothetical protein
MDYWFRIYYALKRVSEEVLYFGIGFFTCVLAACVLYMLSCSPQHPVERNSGDLSSSPNATQKTKKKIGIPAQRLNIVSFILSIEVSIR